MLIGRWSGRSLLALRQSLRHPEWMISTLSQVKKASVLCSLFSVIRNEFLMAVCPPGSLWCNLHGQAPRPLNKSGDRETIAWPWAVFLLCGAAYVCSAPPKKSSKTSLPPYGWCSTPGCDKEAQSGYKRFCKLCFAKNHPRLHERKKKQRKSQKILLKPGLFVKLLRQNN